MASTEIWTCSWNLALDWIITNVHIAELYLNTSRKCAWISGNYDSEDESVAFDHASFKLVVIESYVGRLPVFWANFYWSTKGRTYLGTPNHFVGHVTTKWELPLEFSFQHISTFLFMPNVFCLRRYNFQQMFPTCRLPHQAPSLLSDHYRVFWLPKDRQ